ncbi:MAG: hypothetical protein KAJ13_03410 [Gemmatimonadetes bacterium]|nr:hypothetical protein [Gemmatimonadota bacterium]
MLGVVFFVSVVAVLTGHYLLVERPRRIAGESVMGPRALPLRDLVSRLPAGVFLQPTFTWGQVRPGGDVEIGVHPLLLSLVGPDPELEIRSAGEHVNKGDPLMTVGSGERLEERTIKEVVHEVGHTFGLIHCHDYNCVMHAATYVEDVDLKSTRFCPSCESLLRDEQLQARATG